MSELSKYPLTNLEQDWGAHPTDGLPVAGEEVQRFIKAYLRMAEQASNGLNSKFGYFRFSGNKLQQFANEEDATAYDNGDTDKLICEATVPATGGGSATVSYQLSIKNELSSSNIYVSTGQKAELKFSFSSKVSQNGGAYEDTGERAIVRVSVKKPSDSSYVAVTTVYVPSNTVYSLDVSAYIANGVNQVKLEATGEDSGQEALYRVYSVTKTALSVSAPNFAWWNIFKGAITVPFRIAGTISKTLTVKIAGSGYSKTYTQSLGTTSYTDQPYFYSIPHPGTDGVYSISASLANSDGTLVVTMDPIQVICVNEGSTGRYMAINNVKEEATNWMSNDFFDYSLYASTATSSVTFTIKKGSATIYSATNSSITVGTKQTFTAPLQIETSDNSSFNITISTGLTSAITMPVDNSMGFSATPGAYFVMNPATRTNSQSNRRYWINEADGKQWYNVVSGMNWASDGWIKAEDGNVFRMFAGASMISDFCPLDTTHGGNAARNGKTLEFDFKVTNITNYDTPVIQINGSNNVALLVYPDRVVLRSLAKYQNDDNQSTKFEDGARIRLTVVIMPSAYLNDGFNLAQIYINNVKVREFAYESSDSFYSNGSLEIGSLYADIDIYGFRQYNRSLSVRQVEDNYINYLATMEEKMAARMKNAILDDNGYVDFNLIKQFCNVVVFERGTGNTLSDFIPSYTNQNESLLNWHIYWKDTPANNIVIRNYPTSGQGTTAMTYRFWNLRGKPTSATKITYADDSTSTKSFTFLPGYPMVERLTAKLNFASSPQSNKMGSVNSIADLCSAMGIKSDDNTRLAIYQRPFVGVSMDTNEEGQSVYKFLGLYTIGPDKGDKLTMGEQELSVEGTDNSPLPTLFRVPLTTANFRYNADEEFFEYKIGNTTWQGSWDVNVGDPADASIVAEFLAFYNFIYQCSPKLTYISGGVSTLNGNVSAYQDVDTEYFGDDYVVYYYSQADGRFVASNFGNGDINLKTQLCDKGYGLSTSDLSGVSMAAQAKLFTKARCVKFASEIENYANLDSLLFSRNWTEWIAASDNRAKNTYYKKSKPYAQGGRWCAWFDDTDTIGMITNQGIDRKGYWVEPGDRYDDGGAVFNADSSRLFLLLNEMTDEVTTNTNHTVQKSMTAMMNTMVALSNSTASTTSDKLFDFFYKYYFSQAQDYFPNAAYNAATRSVYEAAYLDRLSTGGASDDADVDPLRQALGDYYSGWKRWLKKRIQYMQSKYSFGDFSASGAGKITYRAPGDNSVSLKLTPAIWMYPNAATGNTIIRGTRTAPGDVCSLTVKGGGDQQMHILGAHYLQSIGDWSSHLVTDELQLTGRMLRSLKLGDATASNVNIKISKLTLSDTPALESIDLRNISTLGDTLDLSKCTHLKRLYAQGTKLSSISFPPGGAMTYIGYSDETQQIILSNYPDLTTSNVDVSACAPMVAKFYIANCSKIAAMQLLASIIEVQQSLADKPLQGIYVAGFSETYSDAAVLEFLASLTTGDYCSVDANGVLDEDSLPTIEGTITIQGPAYEDSVSALKAAFPNLVITADGVYIRFEDPEVMAVLFANGVGDGTGITVEDAEAVTSIGTWFNQNTEIEYFNEFEKFTGVTTLGINNVYSAPFYNCTSLKQIKLPNSITRINTASFSGCTSLELLPDLSNVTYLGNTVFGGCTSMAGVVNIPNVTNDFSGAEFAQTKISKVQLLGQIKRLSYGSNNTTTGTFTQCTNLESVILPETLTTIGVSCFYNCTRLSELVLPKSLQTLANGVFYGCTALEIDDLSLPNLTSLGQNAFYGVKIKKISNLGEITALPTAVGSSQNFGDKSVLEEVVLPETLTSIPQNSLTNYTALTKCHIPSSMVSIGANGFSGCTSLSGDILIPNVVELGSFCFNSTNITSITAPMVQSVGGSATQGRVFYNCKALKTVIMPLVGTLCGDCFSGCTSLESVEFGNLENIMQYAFYNCDSLKELDLGGKIATIGTAAFALSEHLELVVLRTPTPPTIAANSFQGTPIASGTGYIYVPDDSVSSYQSATNWATYASLIKPLSEYNG